MSNDSSVLPKCEKIIGVGRAQFYGGTSEKQGKNWKNDQFLWIFGGNLNFVTLPYFALIKEGLAKISVQNLFLSEGY